MTCEMTLAHAAIAHSLECTSLSWNCSGSVIAACYGRYSHQSWCNDKGYVCFVSLIACAIPTSHSLQWNLQRQAINHNKADTVLEVSSCATRVCWHPDLPSIVAVGTFSGVDAVMAASYLTGHRGDCGV